jgi:hypothetical protein
MKTRRTIGVWGVLASVALACGGGSKASPSGGSGSNGGGTGDSCKTYVACNLLSVSAVNQALGTNLAMGVEADEKNGGSLPTTFVCEYGYAEASPSTLGLFIGCQPSGGQNTAAYYQGYEDLVGGVNTPVSGLGTFAFWHTRSPDSGPLDGGSLTVYFGTSGTFTVFVNLPDVTPVDARAVATEMAMTVLGQL